MVRPHCSHHQFQLQQAAAFCKQVQINPLHTKKTHRRDWLVKDVELLEAKESDGFNLSLVKAKVE